MEMILYLEIPEKYDTAYLPLPALRGHSKENRLSFGVMYL